MNQWSTRTVLTILSLISLTLLMPSTGFGGAETPCGGTGFVLPAYLGNITAEWVPQCETSTSGCVLLYGVLKSTERDYKDITITRKEPKVRPNLDQVSFLSLQPANLLFLQYGLSFDWQGKCYGVSSANDLSYQSETLFTVDVVVMEIN